LVADLVIATPLALVEGAAGVFKLLKAFLNQSSLTFELLSCFQGLVPTGQ
jgi:hypothetical protein